MQPTWLETFHEQTDLNQYPIALRTRSGIGYRKPNGETISNFVGHPVHYFENGLWKPITLQPHANGDFEGSDFSWRGKQVFYKGKTLFEPRAVIFNGVRHNLFLRQDGNRIVADLNFEGSAAQYEVIFSEKGIKELLTIFEPVEGLLEFDVPHANKPNELFKKDRHIVGGIFGESFQLTSNMVYPLRIDPDYAAHTSDGYVYSYDATYATARSTAIGHADGTGYIYVFHEDSAGTYFIYRGFVKYNTAGIPDSDTVSAVTMSMKVNARTGTSGTIQIIKQNWSSHDPLAAGNREAAWDGALSSTLDNTFQTLSAMSAGNRYSSSALDTSYVSKTGYTYYSVVNSNDRANSAPTTINEVEFYDQDYPTSGDRPYLTVTHAAGGSNTTNFFRMF